MSAVDSSDLVILVPMLGRPHHVAPLLESIREATPDARVLFCCTEGDDEVIDAVKYRQGLHLVWLGRGRISVVRFPPRERGDYVAKIAAGVRATTEPYIFTGASDIRFRPGWFEAAVKHFDDTSIGVVGTNDVHSKRAKLPGNEHSTHFLMSRAYAQLPTIDGGPGPFHLGYWHEGCDDELIGTARKRGAYAYAADSMVEHLHPLWVPEIEWDPMYEEMKGERQLAGMRLLGQRRRLWS